MCATFGLLLQVYRARLRATGEEVAVKVQRPDALSTISKVTPLHHFLHDLPPNAFTAHWAWIVYLGCLGACSHNDWVWPHASTGLCVCLTSLHSYLRASNRSTEGKDQMAVNSSCLGDCHAHHCDGPHAMTGLRICLTSLRVHLQDLYVMRRAVVIYERLIRRFTAQTTDYQVLLSTFAGKPPCHAECLSLQKLIPITRILHPVLLQTSQKTWRS